MLIQTNAEEKELTKSKKFYQKFIDQLVLTLNSRARPYSDIKELEKDYSYDTGFNPQLVAMEFGYPSFDALLKSDFMRAHVKITLDDEGRCLFLPHENPAFKHIRDHQLVSQNYIDGKKESEEREKYARAMQPEFREKILEGKRRLVEVAYELGAETKDIYYQDLQAQYLKKYDNMLGPEELRKFFARSNVGKILINYCNDEFVLSKDDTMPGLIFLRLKKPYREIVEMHQRMVNLQKEYEARKSAQEKLRTESSQKRSRMWPKRKKVPLSERQLNLVPVLPKVSEDLFKGISAVGAFGDCQQPSSSFHPLPANNEAEQTIMSNNLEEASEEEQHTYFNWDTVNGPLLSSSLYNNKDGGCTSSNACKSFEDEYGGKANRNVQNTPCHLKQVHRRSSSFEQEEQVESEDTKKPVVRAVNQRNTLSRQSSTSSDGEEVQFKNLHPKQNTDANAILPNNQHFWLTPVKRLGQSEKKQRKIDELLATNNGSLPLTSMANRWKPVDSLLNDKQLNELSRRRNVLLQTSDCQFSSHGQEDVLRKEIFFISPESDNHSSDREVGRTEAIRDFIHAVVRLRSPEFVDLKFLLEALDALDPNHKGVLESIPLRQFIKQNCENVVVGTYKNSVIVGWRK